MKLTVTKCLNYLHAYLFGIKIPKEITLKECRFTTRSKDEYKRIYNLKNKNLDEYSFYISFLKSLNEKSIVADIGANIGIYSIPSSLISNAGLVYSFELDKCNFKCLQKNIKLNKIRNIKAFHFGLSSKRGFVEYSRKGMAGGEGTPRIGENIYKKFKDCLGNFMD